MSRGYRMMGGHNFPRGLRRSCKGPADERHLVKGHASAAPGQTARSVQPENCELIVAVPIAGQCCRRDVVAVFFERRQKAMEQIVERNIVITRNDENGLINLFEEMACLRKLTV